MVLKDEQGQGLTFDLRSKSIPRYALIMSTPVQDVSEQGPLMRQHTHHPNLHLFEHPLIQHKLTQLRDKETVYRDFRALIAQIAGLMLYEATRSFPWDRVRVRTPLQEADGVRITAPITVCPVLRAGLAMSHGILELMPEARVGHIGLYRNESTLEPRMYLSKLPEDLDQGPVVLVDPMLATGGSAAKAGEMLRDAGAVDIRFLCLVAVPEGVANFRQKHPDVPIYAAALDERLDERGYILPGLGDAGDRAFGTLHL